jgi:hypothetical protein
MHNSSVCGPCQEKCCIAPIDFLEQADRDQDDSANADVKMTEIYTHVLQQNLQAVVSPLELLNI